MASIFKQRYTAKGKDGERIRKQSKCWYIEYRDANGTRKRVKGYRDKTASRQLADQLERQTELEQVGVIDRYAEHRSRPLREHLADFRQSLLAKGNTAKYTRQTVRSIKRVLDVCKFVVWPDIQASKVQRCLSEMQNTSDAFGARTFNSYLKAIKQFCKWMVQDRRADESPLEHLGGLNERTDRRHDRRALEPEELKRLLETTAGGPKRYGMTGHERHLLYRFSAETGLRANEVRTLTVGSFDFDKLTVTVRAGYSKHRREDVQHLRRDMATLLQEYFRGKLPTVKAFGGTYKQLTDKTANMLKADLADAGIPYVDDAERFADFHCLRHTTGSLLTASGAHPKIVQSIMRHSDINLTMSRYTHIFRGQESEAVEKLPDFSLQSGNRQRAATGTDNVSANQENVLTGKLTGNSDSCRNPESTIGTDDRRRQGGNKVDHQTGKSLQMPGLDTHRHPLSDDDRGVKKSERCRDRTYDLLIKSQLLYQLS